MHRLDVKTIYGGVSFGGTRSISNIIRRRARTSVEMLGEYVKNSYILSMRFQDGFRDYPSCSLSIYPVHTFVVFHESLLHDSEAREDDKDGWWVLESHARSKVDKHNGVHVVPLSEWFKKENKDALLFEQNDFNLKQGLAHTHKRYGFLDIIKKGITSAMDTQRNTPILKHLTRSVNWGIERIWKHIDNGLICSELYAICCPSIGIKFSLPSYNIEPVHILLNAILNEKEILYFPKNQKGSSSIDGSCLL